MAERGLSTTSTHSQQAPEIPLGHEPSPTRGIDGAMAAPRVVTPATPASPFEANVAAVNRADQACSVLCNSLCALLMIPTSTHSAVKSSRQTDQPWLPARSPVGKPAADSGQRGGICHMLHAP